MLMKFSSSRSARGWYQSLVGVRRGVVGTVRYLTYSKEEVQPEQAWDVEGGLLLGCL